MRYLITGGAGFIGSNFVKYILNKYTTCKVIILDELTYAGNLGTIKDELRDFRVTFIKGDICNKELVESIFANNHIDTVVNFAAESHVDRSIEDSTIFIKTNVMGTQTLMDVAKAHWINGKDDEGYPTYIRGKKFLQVSTDEVYGHLEKDIPCGTAFESDNIYLKKVLANRDITPKVFGSMFFTEESALNPRSPYAASKTSADMLVRAYAETYHFPVNVTRCSNNYGLYHFPEKLIPLIIKNVLEGKKLPIYGNGKQVRDWLYVEDHCKGIDLVINKGRLKEVYNLGGFNEVQNINIAKQIIDIIKDMVFEDKKVKKEYSDFVTISYEDCSHSLITNVQDRLGHDVRYAIDPTKAVKELGFNPETSFAEGIRKTVKWYLENQWWVNEVLSGDYQKYYKNIYGNK